jgi:prephenate dehydrogenase
MFDEAMKYLDEMLKTALKLQFYARIIYSKNPKVQEALEEVKRKVDEIVELIERIKSEELSKLKEYPIGGEG